MIMPTRRRSRARVDVIPLIDVLMVLILFFLTSMQFQELRALNVKLPKIDSAGSNQLNEKLVVSVDQSGNFYLNGNQENLERIGNVMRATSKVSRKTTVLVVADEEVPLKHVTELVDLCRESGLPDFRLQSR